MSKHHPRVSVGMPVFNGEPYLAAAIESIIAQTFSDFELIISDNASTDDTESICRDFADRDIRIKYHRNAENLGAAKNYNRVFELSRGEYFKWATSDDLCATSYLEKCVDVLDSHRDVVLCFGRSNAIDETGTVIREYESGLHLLSNYETGRYLQLRYNLGNCDALCGVHRSDVLRQTRLIGNYIAADTCMLAELCLLGKFWEIPEHLFFRRHHVGSSSSQENRDDQSQLEFYDPQLKGHIVMRGWRLHWEHFKIIYRSKLRARQKGLLMLHLAAGLISHQRPLAREFGAATSAMLNHRMHKWNGQKAAQGIHFGRKKSPKASGKIS